MSTPEIVSAILLGAVYTKQELTQPISGRTSANVSPRLVIDRKLCKVTIPQRVDRAGASTPNTRAASLHNTAALGSILSPQQSEAYVFAILPYGSLFFGQRHGFWRDFARRQRLNAQLVATT